MNGQLGRVQFTTQQKLAYCNVSLADMKKNEWKILEMNEKANVV